MTALGCDCNVVIRLAQGGDVFLHTWEKRGPAVGLQDRALEGFDWLGSGQAAAMVFKPFSPEQLGADGGLNQFCRAQ